MATIAELGVKILMDVRQFEEATRGIVARLNEIESLTPRLEGTANAPIECFERVAATAETTAKRVAAAFESSRPTLAVPTADFSQLATDAETTAKRVATAFASCERSVEKVGNAAKTKTLVDAFGAAEDAAKSATHETSKFVELVSEPTAPTAIRRATDALRDFSTRTDSAIRKIQDLGVAVGQTGAKFGLWSRGMGYAISGASQIGPTIVKTVAAFSLFAVGAGIVNAACRGISVSSAIASAALSRLQLLFATTAAQMALLGTRVVMVAAIVSLEIMRERTAELIGETTKFQKVWESTVEVWSRWSEALIGPTFDALTAGLGVVVAGLSVLRDVLDGLESIPFLGPLVSGLERVVVLLPTVVSLFALLKVASAFILNGALTKAVIGIVAAIYTKIAALVAWQLRLIGLNAQLIMRNVLTGVGIALVIAATAAAIGYATATANAAETTADFSAATSQLGDAAKTTAERYKTLADEIARANAEARTPNQKYADELARIDERANAETAASETLAALNEKERALMAALAGENGRLTRAQKKEAAERLESIRKERDELQKAFVESESYSDAARKRDREKARENYLQNLGVGNLFQDSAAEKFDKQRAALQTAFAAKQIDATQFAAALDKARREFERADPATQERARAEAAFAQTVDAARQKAENVLAPNLQKAAEAFAGFRALDLSSYSDADRSKVVAAFNDEYLRATQNGAFLADALAPVSTTAAELDAALADLTDAAQYLDTSTITTTERDAALRAAKQKLTESILSRSETGKYLVDAQKAAIPFADRYADALADLESQAKSAGIADATLADARRSLTESLLNETAAGKYLIDAQKKATPKAERLAKIYADLESTALALGVADEVLEAAKKAAADDLDAEDAEDAKTEKETKSQNAAILRGTTAALEAIAANGDPTLPYLRETATNSRKQSRLLEEIARNTKKEEETYNG